MERLKALRIEKGFSQQRVAEGIGSNQQSIYRYENGFYEPDITTLKLLADFFETSIDYLVGSTDIRRRIEAVRPFDLNEEETILIKKYRQLRGGARKSVMVMIDALLEQEKYCKQNLLKSMIILISI